VACDCFDRHVPRRLGPWRPRRWWRRRSRWWWGDVSRRRRHVSAERRWNVAPSAPPERGAEPLAVDEPISSVARAVSGGTSRAASLGKSVSASCRSPRKQLLAVELGACRGGRSSWRRSTTRGWSTACCRCAAYYRSKTGHWSSPGRCGWRRSALGERLTGLSGIAVHGGPTGSGDWRRSTGRGDATCNTSGRRRCERGGATCHGRRGRRRTRGRGRRRWSGRCGKARRWSAWRTGHRWSARRP
jgi:hypothetical protein